MFQIEGIAPEAGALDEAAVARVTAPNSPAFGDLQTLLQLLADPAAFRARLDQLIAATVKADEAKAAMVRQHAVSTARENEIEAQQKQLADRFVMVQQAEARNRQTQSELLAIADRIRRAEDQLKLEVLRYAGITVNEALQQLPDFDALAQMTLGTRNDAHLDGNQTTTLRDQPSGETESVEHASPSTLRRSVPSRRSTRADKRGVFLPT
jgi:hypothetical protein